MESIFGISLRREGTLLSVKCAFQILSHSHDSEREIVIKGEMSIWDCDLLQDNTTNVKLYILLD